MKGKWLIDQSPFYRQSGQDGLGHTDKAASFTESSQLQTSYLLSEHKRNQIWSIAMRRPVGDQPKESQRISLEDWTVRLPVVLDQHCMRKFHRRWLRFIKIKSHFRIGFEHFKRFRPKLFAGESPLAGLLPKTRRPINFGMIRTIKKRPKALGNWDIGDHTKSESRTNPVRDESK